MTSSDLKAASVETRISVGARISELVYLAGPSPALSKTPLAGADAPAHLISNPSSALLAALAKAEDDSAAIAPAIIKLQITADTRLRHPDLGSASFERTLADAHALFLDQLNPWDGPCIASAVACFDHTGRPLPRDSSSTSGVKTVFGSAAGQAYVEVFLHPLAGSDQAAAGERCLRMNLVLSRAACAANGISDLRSLLAANGRQIFGRYIHLSSGGKHAGMGDLNARIKREFSRMLTRAGAGK